MKKIKLGKEKLYKLSMGTFLKSPAFKKTNLLETFEKNQWAVMGRYTTYSQGHDWMNRVTIGDYLYITFGYEKLSYLVQVKSNFQELPNDINNTIGDEDFGYRTYEIICDPLINNTRSLTNDKRWWLPSGYSTLREITDIKEANEILFEPFYNLNFTTSEKEPKEMINNYTPPTLNQIFYGPPGTGKTYTTLLEAAKIVSKNENITYEEAKDIFNRERGNQIEFITFHQNYGYEDFIQGLRPDTETNGQLSFYKKDGVFKKIADDALNNLKDSKNPLLAKRSFEEVFYEFVAPLIEGTKKEIEVTMKKTSYYITEVGEKSIEFRKNQGDSKHTLSIATLKKMYKNGVNDIILGGLQPYYNPFLEELLKEGKQETSKIEEKNFVIIIDEINRANISRVFGELITLIEKDKRSHGALPLTATLPSGEKFIVPSNLYIIGTMNTADKSIALLDIALRRRFEFKAMYPQYKIENKTIYEVDFLKTLNQLIVKSGKGHDFTIGHSYFMCAENETFDFKNTVDTKVIPLLLEYYMNDEDEVKKILNEALKSTNYKVENWPLEMVTND